MKTRVPIAAAKDLTSKLFAERYFKMPLVAYERYVEDAATRDHDVFITYAALVSQAAWAPKDVSGSHGKISLQQGQTVIGVPTFARECGLSERKVRRTLDVLREDGFIKISASKRGTVVTVCGHREHYFKQRDEPQTSKPLTSLTVVFDSGSKEAVS